METPVVNETSPSVDSAAPPIRLQIAGADLLLSGRFSRWTPVLMSEAQDATDAVQILFDVTSNRAPAGGGGDLFTFKARSVAPVKGQSYKLKGTLTAGGTSGEVEAVLQNPPGHTPFFVLLFRFDRQAFPTVWSAFEDRAAGVEASGQQELRPEAWVREPALAAA
jgi:hypothetical protein